MGPFELLEDKGYKTGKGTVQIKFEQKVPSEILTKVLLAHAKLNKATAEQYNKL